MAARASERGKGPIKAISQRDVHRICSGQVITDLKTAVKELVENAVDAGAKSVEVNLVRYGADLLEVSDNGCGVPKDNYAGLVAKYHTSKIRQFDDIWGVASFGFRGEALSSLCELCEDFTVTTRCEEDDMATKLTYDRQGVLAKSEPAARTTGTTVTAQGLFVPLPVRRREFSKALKKQLSRALHLLNAYAVICSQVRFLVRHKATPGGKWSTVLSTAGNGRMRDAVSRVFGPKFLGGLEPLHVDLAQATQLQPQAAPVAASTPSTLGSPEGAGQALETSLNSTPGVQGAPPAPCSPAKPLLTGSIEGFVSAAGAGVGRSNNDRQFLFVNRRPVDMPALARVVNEVWRKYEMKHKPAFILDLNLPPRTFDINVAPDKRDIILTEQGALLDALKAALHERWVVSRGRFAVSGANGSLAAKAGQGSIPTIQGMLAARAARAQSEGALPRPESPVATHARPGTPEAVPGSPTASAAPGAVGEAGFHGDAVVSQPPQAEGEEPAAAEQVGVGQHPPARDTDGASDGGESQSVTAVGAVAPAQGSGWHIASVLAPSPTPASPPPQSGKRTITTTRGRSRRAPQAGGGGLVQDAPSPPAAVLPPPAQSGAHATEQHALEPPVATAAPPQAVPSPRHRGTKRPRAAVVIQSDDDDSSDEDQEQQPDVPPTQGTAVDSEEEGEEGDVSVVAAEQSTEKSVDQHAQCVTPPRAKRRRRDSAGVQQTEHMDWGFLGGVGPVQTPDAPPLGHTAARDRAGQDTAALVSAPCNVFEADTDEEGEEGAAEAPPPVGPTADAAMSRVLTKEKFKSMQVLGQFNLGFIVAASGSDLFILDQHACDEKVRYERYTENLHLHQQPLIVPQPLDMTAAEELIVLEHLDVFRANGFTFVVDEDAAPGHRAKLRSIPFSQKRQFGVEDVRELASMLAQDPFAARRGTLRLPRIEYMLASRACRSAIMIGDPLTRDQMRRVVTGMAPLDQPWNCPHGRPTMRHLVDLAHVQAPKADPPLRP